MQALAPEKSVHSTCPRNDGRRLVRIRILRYFYLVSFLLLLALIPIIFLVLPFGAMLSPIFSAISSAAGCVRGLRGMGASASIQIVDEREHRSASSTSMMNSPSIQASRRLDIRFRVSFACFTSREGCNLTNWKTRILSAFHFRSTVCQHV